MSWEKRKRSKKLSEKSHDYSLLEHIVGACLTWDSVVRSTKELFGSCIQQRASYANIETWKSVSDRRGIWESLKKADNKADTITTKTVYFACRSCASKFFNPVWIMSNDERISTQIHGKNNIWISIFLTLIAPLYRKVSSLYTD